MTTRLALRFKEERERAELQRENKWSGTKKRKERIIEGGQGKE